MSPILTVAMVSMVVTAAALAFTPITVDEGWFVQVCRRVVDGERLYEDVFYGAAPIPVWLCAAAFKILRPQAVVARSLAVLYVAATSAASTWALTAAGASDGPGGVRGAAGTGLLRPACRDPQPLRHTHPCRAHRIGGGVAFRSYNRMLWMTGFG